MNNSNQIKTNVENAIFQMQIGLSDINENNFWVIVQVCRDYDLLDWLRKQQDILGISWDKLIKDYKDVNVK